MPDSDSGSSFQGVPGVEGLAEGSAGGCVEGNWEVEESAEDPRPPDLRAVLEFLYARDVEG